MTDAQEEGESPAGLIDAKIAALGDWRGETLAQIRAIIRKADPEVIETVKWRKADQPRRRARLGA
jgi:hypothetical protein